MGLPLLQLPKTKDFFGGMIAEPGKSLIGMDWTALEPHVTAYLSRDKRMLQLYGPNAQPNDIYIFFGSATPQYGPKFRELGYDPDAPTKEAIKIIKSQCQDERQVCKKLVLLFNYNGGPRKAQSELQIAGFNVSLEDAKIMHETYWNFFSGIKSLEQRLKTELRKNGGWLLGIRGEPITIPKPHKYWDDEAGKYLTIDFSKDIVNRVVQRTGSDINKRFVWHLNRLRLERGVPMTPYIPDLHDASYWQVDDDAIEAARLVFQDAVTTVNQELGWDVKIKGSIKVGKKMSDFIDD